MLLCVVAWSWIHFRLQNIISLTLFFIESEKSLCFISLVSLQFQDVMQNHSIAPYTTHLIPIPIPSIRSSLPYEEWKVIRMEREKYSILIEFPKFFTFSVMWIVVYIKSSRNTCTAIVFCILSKNRLHASIGSYNRDIFTRKIIPVLSIVMQSRTVGTRSYLIRLFSARFSR